MSWIVPIFVGFALMMCAFTAVLVFNKWRKQRDRHTERQDHINAADD